MTSEQGLNLAGVETVLDLERKVERMKSELERMRKRAAELERGPRYTRMRPASVLSAKGA